MYIYLDLGISLVGTNPKESIKNSPKGFLYNNQQSTSHDPLKVRTGNNQ